MSKIGLCAVYFQDPGKFTRWAIQDDWKHYREYTLTRVTQKIADQIDASTVEPGATRDGLIERLLLELVVDAAAEMDLKVLPCRSSALMQHLGWPCFPIETGGPGQNSVRPMESRSWREADEMIDRFEAGWGNPNVRIRSEGDQVTVLIPGNGHTPVLPSGTLTGLLQPLEEQLQAALRPKPPKGLKPFFGRARPKMWHKR
jgi:hypothetical protein